MDIKCQFEFCKWVGPFDSVLKHCKAKHKQFVKKLIADEKWLRIYFDELLMPTLLLIGLHGDLYWSVLYPRFTKKYFRRGIFAIGGSTLCYYLAQIGIEGDRTVVNLLYHKVIGMKPDENEENYSLKFVEIGFEFMNTENMKSNTMAIMFYFDPKDKKEYVNAINPCLVCPDFYLR